MLGVRADHEPAQGWATMGEFKTIEDADPSVIREEVDALIRGQGLRAVFQPILGFRGGLTAAREALIRPPADGPFRDAGQMFEAAQAADRLWDLERACRETTFAAAETLAPGEFLFTNVSPQVFSDPRIVDDVLALCRNSRRLEPNHITIELTERSKTTSVDILSRQADAFRGHGFQLAIDDVGAGTSGLNRIMRLRPNWLKLDRELVMNLDVDPFRRNLIQFFVHFARLSSILLVAEGIEREEELRTAIELGVGYGQGYLLARPASARQPIDPMWQELIPHMRHRMEGRQFQDPRMAPIGELAQPLISCPASTTVACALAIVDRIDSAGSLAVVDGARVLGTLSAAEMRETCKAAPDTPLAQICRPCVIVASPDMTVAETIQWAVLRPDREIMEPILVASEDVVGLLSMRSLMIAAGRMRPEGSPHTSSLTGLPNRVQLDFQIQLRNERRLATAAAVIDLRSFHRYNQAYGVELGDAMLRQLAALLMFEFGEAESDEFIAHVADDHFFLLSPRTDLAVRVRILGAEFDRARGEFFSAADMERGSFASTWEGPSVLLPLCSVRACVVPDINDHVRSSGDLFNIALRGRRREEAGSPSIHSTVTILGAKEASPRCDAA